MTAPTLDVGIDEGPYAGWRATVVMSFPFRTIRDLQSGDMDRVQAACQRLIVHLAIDGAPTDLDDADVFGVIAIVDAAMKARTALPNR